tara:strand:- start:60 stop:479 length:420 start_codon:yes stop_codon:yes gene_type:complete
MTTLIEKQNSIIEDFELFDDWMQKYEYLIELGKDLPIINPEDKKDSQLIEGCQSRVWLDALYLDGKMKFKADSDAIITKGIISLLIDILDNQSPANIIKSDLFFINKIGLQDHLSPTRANGLLSMVKRMKQESLKYINQ